MGAPKPEEKCAQGALDGETRERLAGSGSEVQGLRRVQR